MSTPFNSLTHVKYYEHSLRDVECEINIIFASMVALGCQLISGGTIICKLVELVESVIIAAEGIACVA